MGPLSAVAEGTSPPIQEPPKLTRAQRRLLKWNEANWKAINDEIQRRIREGDFEGAAEIGYAIWEALQGTLHLSLATRRLEITTYVLTALTGVLAVLTFLLWTGIR